jgi:hypothetical protein
MSSEGAMAVNVLDPELSFLASEAAVELDSVINKQPSGLESVRELAQRIQLSIDKTSATNSARNLLTDTATLTVIGQAFDLADSKKPLKDVNDLTARFGEIADQLSNTTADCPAEKLDTARAFCLALSKSVAAYRKSVYDLRQPHPFRRLG